MKMNLFLFLCIALILVVDTKVEVVADVVSNLTDSRFGGSENVTNVIDSKSRDHSKNSTDDNTQLSGGGDRTSKKIASDDESESTKEDSITNSLKEKQGFLHGEQCDPSNMCTDEQDKFVACLRVPGNDAPHLSLLIQNKGKSALLVTLTAPGSVLLDKDKVQLMANEDTKVKVSIKKGVSNDSAIILTSSKGSCSLELKDLAAAHETENEDTVSVSRPSMLNIRPRTLIVIIMISFLVLSLVIIPVIIHVCRNKSRENNKYQRLDMELPVSSPTLVTKSDQETGDDGWNNNWGDDWDDENGDGDEEQPHTPVLPVTPSLSSRGLASRRLSKEGWKD